MNDFSIYESDIEDILTKRSNIIIIGDIMIDHYIFGDVSRISPEAPIPIVQIEYEEDRLGGAANVANNIKSLGFNPKLVSITGEDGFDVISKLLKKNSIPGCNISFDKKYNTIIKTRILARHQQLLRIDKDNNKKLDSQRVRQFLNSIDALLNSKLTTAIVIQDYNKGMITQELVDGLHKIVKNRVPILVDPNPNNNINYLNKIDLIKPNFYEALALTGMNFKINENSILDENMIELGQKLHRLTNCKYIIITLGAHGAIIFENGQYRNNMLKLAKDVFDVCGAGDSFISTLAVSLSVKDDINLATTFANVVSSIVVGKLGTSVVTKKEILEFLEKEREPLSVFDSREWCMNN